MQGVPRGRRMGRCWTGWRSSEKVPIAPQLVEVNGTRLADGVQVSSAFEGFSDAVFHHVRRSRETDRQTDRKGGGGE